MTILFDLDIEGWPESSENGGWEGLLDRVGETASFVARELVNPRLIVSVLFTTDKEIHALNRQWRERDKPTNVLSFPMLERGEVLELVEKGPPVMLGDIALAYETCAREAAEKSVTLQDHTAHLLVHGLLHLAGYDHVESDAQAEAMEAMEIRALAKMGIADPYGDRS